MVMNVLDDTPAQSPNDSRPKLRDFHMEDIFHIIGKFVPKTLLTQNVDFMTDSVVLLLIQI